MVPYFRRVLCKCNRFFCNDIVSFSKCIHRCISTTRIAATLSLPIADRSRDMHRSGPSQSQGPVERQRNRWVTWDGSSPLRLPPCSPKVESSTEKGGIFRLSESVSFTWFFPCVSFAARKKDRKTIRPRRRKPLTPQLSLLFTPRIPRVRQYRYRHPLPDTVRCVTRATKIDFQ